MRRVSVSALFKTKSFIGMLFLLVGLSAGTTILKAQSFDHAKHPRLDFDFQRLELDLGIQPQNLRIDGAARYDIRANVSGADTLTLYASHIDVSSVSVDGEPAEFSLHNDSLFVQVDDSSEAGQQYRVSVRYSGRPQFGLLKNHNGTVWTSQLPKAQRHWVPIVDNPHVEMKTAFNISVPSGYRVWATGDKTGEEVVSVEVVTYRFASERPVPASSLAFGIGDFSSSSAENDSYKINLAVERPLKDSVDIFGTSQKALDLLEDLSKRTALAYPYRALNVFVLEDHSWETKSWGASAVYLYENRGDLETQLLRGIIGQWMGIQMRESRWSEADAISLYQTLLANDIANGNPLLAVRDVPERTYETVYDGFGAERWNNWQKDIENWQSPFIRSFVLDSASAAMRELPEVIDWSDPAGFWYRRTGQPIFDMPQLSVQRQVEEKQSADTVKYDVYYSFNEAEGEIKLRFSSTQGAIKELTTLSATEIYPGKTEQSEVTFTGAEDSVMLNVEPTISNLRLDTEGHPRLKLEEYKPAPFLIYQIRSGETTGERAAAARKLGYHSENPDLQLAIKDFMNRELEPEVRAALLSSLAAITDGAEGTEQTFIDALQSGNPHIRDAGLMALQNYKKDNESIRNRVTAVARKADSFGLFRKATQVLTAISSQQQFAGFVETVTSQDTVGKQSIFAIQELANMGNVEQAVQQAGLFTDSDYRFDIRRRALEILIQHDHAPSNWMSRAEELLDDPDPRIRFLTVAGLERNKNQEVISFLNDYLPDEYDARVYRRIQQFVE